MKVISKGKFNDNTDGIKMEIKEVAEIVELSGDMSFDEIDMCVEDDDGYIIISDEEDDDESL